MYFSSACMYMNMMYVLETKTPHSMHNYNYNLIIIYMHACLQGAVGLCCTACKQGKHASLVKYVRGNVFH